MGRSRLIPFVIHYKCSDGHRYTPSEWRVRQQRNMPKHHVDGTPTTDNIDKWVTAFEDSRKHGGVNAHLGFALVTEAWIVDQKDTPTVVARWLRSEVRPLFQVI